MAGAFCSVAVAAILLGAWGCSRSQPPALDEVAKALRERGIRYEVSETAALPGVRAEGLFLRGPGLSLEIYRAADEREWNRLLEAADCALREAQPAGSSVSAKPVARKPLLLIVRREPWDGAVESALEAALSR